MDLVYFQILWALWFSSFGMDQSPSNKMCYSNRASGSSLPFHIQRSHIHFSNVQGIGVLNFTLFYAAVLINYWIIVIESFAQKPAQEAFWRIHGQLNDSEQSRSMKQEYLCKFGIHLIFFCNFDSSCSSEQKHRKLFYSDSLHTSIRMQQLFILSFALLKSDQTRANKNLQHTEIPSLLCVSISNGLERNWRTISTRPWIDHLHKCTFWLVKFRNDSSLLLYIVQLFELGLRTTRSPSWRIWFVLLRLSRYEQEF